MMSTGTPIPFLIRFGAYFNKIPATLIRNDVNCLYKILWDSPFARRRCIENSLNIRKCPARRFMS